MSEEEEKAILTELIFCINSPQTRYTSNIKGEELMELVNALPSLSTEELAKRYTGRIRFPNNKARYGISAYQQFPAILALLGQDMTPRDKREWLVRHVKGLSYKEASHFLRNIHRDNGELAILDIHILRYLNHQRTYVLSRKEYLKYEGVFLEKAKALGIPAGDLDVKLWEEYRVK